MDNHDSYPYYSCDYFAFDWATRSDQKKFGYNQSVSIAGMVESMFYLFFSISYQVSMLVFFATGGWPSTLGFLILNTLWLGITILGYVAIRRKKINLHRQWILRSFFLSFANITIYILVAISHNALNLPYSLSYTIAVWLCWVLNLAIAEIIIRKKVFSS